MPRTFLTRRTGRRAAAAFAATAALASAAVPSASAAETWKGIATDRAIAGNSAKLTSLDGLTPAAGTAITGNGHAAAIAPDGQTAWVVGVSSTGSTITKVDLAASPITAGAPVTIGGPAVLQCTTGGFYNFFYGATAIALTPSGTRAYVTSSSDDAVYPVDLTAATPVVGPAIPLAAGSRPVGIAIDPLGDTAYVVGQASGTVTPISLASGMAGVPFALAAGAKPSAIAITPDGKDAYVAISNRAAVAPITLSTLTVGAEIPTGAGTSPSGVAITADGSRAYVTNGGGESPCPGATPGNTSVTPIATATRTALANFTVSGSQVKPVSPALTPDGRRLFVAPFVNSDGSPTTTTVVRDLVANTNVSLQTGFATTGLAIAADQAPTASFIRTGTLAGAPVSFDASASSTPVGTIAKYDWAFGDGATATTAGPTTSHTYLTPGEKTATLTVTNSAGTSTTRVFTGQMVRRNGGPSAQTTRAFALVAAGVPVARLSPAAVDFGTAGPGAALERPVTLSNPGDAPLTFRSAETTGEGFSVLPGACAGAVLAPGASCELTARFAPPTSDRGFDGQLVVATDAPDREVRIGLSGRTSTAATIRGQVTDDTAGRTPISGLTVLACPSTPRDAASCAQTRTDAAGGYVFAGRSPGAYRLEVRPIEARVFGASAFVDVAAGATVTRDFALGPADRFPGTYEFSQSSGSTRGGVPVIRDDSPFNIGVPANIAPAGRPGSKRIYLYLMAFGPNDGTGGFDSSLVSLVGFVVEYGANGRPAALSPVMEAIGGAATAGARASRTARQRTAALASLATRLQAGGAGGCGSDGFRIGPSPGGGIQLTIDFIDGPVALALDPATLPPPPALGNAALDFAAGRLQSSADSAFQAQPGVVAYNTAIKILNAALYARDGNYAGALRQAVVNFGLPALEERLPRAGGVHGAATARIWSMASDAATTRTENLLDSAPAPASCSRQEGNLYIDPSGNVVTKKGGIPLEKAKVVLQRADAAAGPFTAVPNGSDIMSPSNRVTPDLTDRDGHFGWDVIPGFYRVDASKAGCKSTTSSRIMEIPPPVTDLLLALDCKPGKRAATTVVAKRQGPSKGLAKLSATVTLKGRRKAAVGVVAFRRGGKEIVRAPLDRRGTARSTVDLSKAAGGAVTAQFLGDARLAPSRAKVR